MSYVLPNFNLNCNIWSYASGPPLVPRLSSICNLAYSKRFHTAAGGGPVDLMFLLLPAHTDIRAYPIVLATATDWVEVPAGSKCYYTVEAVNDAGKGFPNEHRVATIVPVNTFGLWPTPMP